MTLVYPPPEPDPADQPLTAAGGWCAPATGYRWGYSLWAHPWDSPDHGMGWQWARTWSNQGTRLDRLVAPRLTEALARAYTARSYLQAAWRQLGAAAQAVRTPSSRFLHDSDTWDEW